MGDAADAERTARHSLSAFFRFMFAGGVACSGGGGLDSALKACRYRSNARLRCCLAISPAVAMDQQASTAGTEDIEY